MTTAQRRRIKWTPIEGIHERRPICSQSSEAQEKRWDRAIDRVLNSGLMHGYMDIFWAYVDGRITYDEFNERMSP